MFTNNFSYGQMLGNRYRLTFALIDKRDRPCIVFIGETHAGDARAERVETIIKQLLREDIAG